MQFHASIYTLQRWSTKMLVHVHRLLLSPRREKIKRKAERKYLVLVLSQHPDYA